MIKVLDKKQVDNDKEEIKFYFQNIEILKKLKKERQLLKSKTTLNKDEKRILMHLDLSISGKTKILNDIMQSVTVTA